MFAYCGNNPINRIDPNGEAWMDTMFKYMPIIVFTVHKTLNYFKELLKLLNNMETFPNISKAKTVYRGSIRICTDGSNGDLIPDDTYLPNTSLEHNNKPIDAYTVPYVVMPLGDTTVKKGDCAILINHDTNKSVTCVVGEVGPKENGWGEVSIAAIWKTGNPNHMSANHTNGLSDNYQIIVFPGCKYKWED